MYFEGVRLRFFRVQKWGFCSYWAVKIEVFSCAGIGMLFIKGASARKWAHFRTGLVMFSYAAFRSFSSLYTFVRAFLKDCFVILSPPASFLASMEIGQSSRFLNSSIILA